MSRSTCRAPRSRNRAVASCPSGSKRRGVRAVPGTPGTVQFRRTARACTDGRDARLSPEGAPRDMTTADASGGAPGRTARTGVPRAGPPLLFPGRSADSRAPVLRFPRARAGVRQSCDPVRDSAPFRDDARALRHIFPANVSYGPPTIQTGTNGFHPSEATRHGSPRGYRRRGRAPSARRDLTAAAPERRRVGCHHQSMGASGSAPSGASRRVRSGARRAVARGQVDGRCHGCRQRFGVGRGECSAAVEDQSDRLARNRACSRSRRWPVGRNAHPTDQEPAGA